MTSTDIYPNEGVYHDASVARDTSLRDMRLDRNSQADLHTAVDLAYAFAAAIKALHPIAEKQVKAMIFQGNLI